MLFSLVFGQTKHSKWLVRGVFNESLKFQKNIVWTQQSSAVACSVGRVLFPWQAGLPDKTLWSVVLRLSLNRKHSFPQRTQRFSQSPLPENPPDQKTNQHPSFGSYLHPRLHHVQRRVSKNTGCSCRRSKHGRHNWVHLPSGIVTFEARSQTGAQTRTTFNQNRIMASHCVWSLNLLTFVPVPQRGHDVEPDGLVASLFQNSGCQTLICAPQT